MDYNNNANRTDGWSHNPGSRMATAAMLLGIAAFFTIITVYVPLALACLAILFAILSKGYGKKLMTTAKVGIGAAVGSLVIILTLIISAFSLLLTCSGDTLIKLGQQLDQQYETQTGTSIEDIVGESYEDIMREYVDLLGK